MMKTNILQRRQFLKSTAATGLGLTILPSGILSGANAPSNKLNVAMIGTGGQGMQNLRNLLEEDDVQIVAIADTAEWADYSRFYHQVPGGRLPAAERINTRYASQTSTADSPGCRVYVDFRTMLDEVGDYDAVVVSTPDHTHAVTAMAAIERKKHVYMEKPLARTISEVRRLTEAAAEAVGLGLVEPKGWTCCGSAPAHKLNPDDAVRMPLENLALIERSGFQEVAVPCAGCFLRFRSVQHEIREDPALKERMDEAIGYEYQDTVEVRSLLDVMAERVGEEAIAENVQKPLEGLKVACYYGCALVRPPEIVGAPHHEYPMSMDRVVNALGAEAVDWNGKTRCCGVELAIAVPERGIELCRWLIEQARAVGADCLAVACPLCHANLDGRQLQMKDLEQKMPILYFTQLMALAFGVEPKTAGLHKNLVDPFPLLQEKGLVDW